MTPDTCLKIAKVTGFLLSNKSSKKNRVIISKDTRLSGYLFEPLIASGFISMGMDVILVGPLPTPALPVLINSLRADMGVMITASHNTYEYNGLKFFDSNGDKISKNLEIEIENIVLNHKKYLNIINKNTKTGKALRLKDAQGRYSEFLKLKLEKKINFNKIKVILDCGNGATYRIAPKIFWELGCDVVAINNQPDGKNINLNCGAVNVKTLSQKVLTTKADVGFAFDGDGDRLIVVDNRGNEIDGDKILALFTKNLLNNNKLTKKTVVATSMSNLGFENYLTKKLGVKLVRTNVGDINVINEMKKKSYSLGGEQSGHIILGEYTKTGDAILVALKILEIIKNSNLETHTLFNNYNSFYQEKINILIKEQLNNKAKNLIKNISNKTQRKNPHLRYLIRESGTEPLIRILVEGKNKKEIKKESKILLNQIEKIVND